MKWMLLVRHGVAGRREDFAKINKNDDLRPLTEKGRVRMKKNAKGIHRLVKDLDLVASSNLTRALQTAQIIKSVYGPLKHEITESLRPDSHPSEWMKWINQQKTQIEKVAVVGHSPHLNRLASFFLTKEGESFFDIRKGGICLLEFPGKIEKGSATLACLIQPSQLRMLARK